MSGSWGIFSETFFSQNFFFRILQPQKPVFTLPTKVPEIVRRFDTPKDLKDMLGARSPGQSGLGIESIPNQIHFAAANI